MVFIFEGCWQKQPDIMGRYGSRTHNAIAYTTDIQEDKGEDTQER